MKYKVCSSVPVLLVTMLPLLNAKLFSSLNRNRRHENYKPVPDSVIGIFRSDTCSPAEAVSLAVNRNNDKGIQAFTYNILSPTEMNTLTYMEVALSLNNSIIITGEPSSMEKLSNIWKTMPNLNSYLIYYGPLYPNLYEILNSTRNLFFSGQSPKPFIQCIFNLIRLIKINLLPTIAEQVEEKQENVMELKDNYSLTAAIEDTETVIKVSLVFDPSLPCEIIARDLSFNLRRSMKFDVDTIWTGESSSSVYDTFSMRLSDSMNNSSFPVVVVAADDFHTRSLLCALHRKTCTGEIKGYTLILINEPASLYTGRWLENDEQMENYKTKSESELICKYDEILAAAEGHFLLEFPAWEINDEIETKLMKRELNQMLKNSGEHIRSDYDEAPLAYDSARAIMQAVTKSKIDFSPESSDDDSIQPGLHFRLHINNQVASNLIDSFYGISGEFSINGHTKMRSGRRVISLNWFENGTYTKIGNYFIFNSSMDKFGFSLDKFWIGREDVWDSMWNTSRLEIHSQCLTTSLTSNSSATSPDRSPVCGCGQNVLTMAVLYFVVITTILFLLIFAFTQFKKSRRLGK